MRHRKGRLTERNVKPDHIPLFYVLVISEESKPRVKITKSLRFGKTLLVCDVIPQGRGDLMWRRDGSRIKYENRTATLELDPPSPREEYECYGNLTVAGFMFFRSSAYATGESNRLKKFCNFSTGYTFL